MKEPPKARSSRGEHKHPNSHAREVAMQALYQMDVAETPLLVALRLQWLNEPLPATERQFFEGILHGVADRWELLNEVIRSFATKELSSINAVIRAILRMGLYEIIRGELESRIIIDDLLDLTRKYDNEESVAFVNAILDSFDRERRKEQG